MPLFDPVTNFCEVTVNQGYDSAATSIVIVSTDPNLAQLLDPATYGAYNLVWWNFTAYPRGPALDPDREVVRVTAKNSNTLTVTRGQEGTSASNKNVANATYKMILAPTKKLRDDLEDAAIDVGSAYGYVTESDFGAEGDGVTDDRGAFNSAAGVLTHIVVPSGTYKFSSNITFGTGITLEIRPGAQLSPDSGVTITINGDIQAGNYQIFTGSGTVTIGTRCLLRYDRWDGTASDKVQLYGNLEMTGSTLVEGGVTVVESGSLDVSSTGVKTCTIAHGLSYTPVASQVTLTAYRSSGSNEPEIDGMYIESIDGTNIEVHFNVTTAAATTNMKVAARIWEV